MTKKTRKTTGRKDALSTLSNYERTDIENTIGVLSILCGAQTTLGEVAERLAIVRREYARKHGEPRITINL